MDSLKKVYSKIKKENIDIFNYNIPFDTEAVTIETDNNYGIFVDYKKINCQSEEFLIMAHEYGHCKSGATHKTNSKYELIEKHEYKANRQSILTFLPIRTLRKAISSGYTKPYEIAEFLDLPEPFVIMAIGHYKCMEQI